MKPEFSEFSFGFAYIFQVANIWKNNLIESPILPNLYEEGKEDGTGYDARLAKTGGFVYCMQFKLTEYMKGPTAKEANDKTKKYPRPYYRFSIYGDRQSRQHELLCGLESKYGTRVEYVAPLFYEKEVLDDFFKT